MGAEAQDIGLEGWQVAWVQSIRAGDVLLFATGVLGFLMPGVPNPNGDPQLEPWQVVALKKYGNAWRNRMTKPGRLSIRAGHGVGKTTFLCIVIIFTLFAGGPDTKIPVVANSMDQLRDGLWPEANKWIQRLPADLRGEIDWQKEKIAMRCAPEECFAVRRTASKHRPEAMQGMHSRTLVAIFEEASGLPEETVEAGWGSLSTPGAIAVAVGNPTRAIGFFHKTHTDAAMRAIWDTMIVNAEDVPRARGHIDDIIRMYGKDSNRYRVRVLGEFPTKDDDTVIPLELILAAKGRAVQRSHVWPVWGLDVSRFGDDRSVLIRRQGNMLIHAPTVWQNMDGTQISGRVLREWDTTPNDLKPKEICIDVIGYGASVVDQLRLEGSPVKTIITAVNVAESPSTDDSNHRLRDELWWKGREWFAARDCCFPLDIMNIRSEAGELLVEQLIGELSSVTYDINEKGKRVVESKKDMKRDGKRSPDMADAFLLTFAAGVYPNNPDVHRDRWRDEMESNPWAA